MDLRETTSYLLRTPDVAEWIKLADSHMQAYNRMPERFVLPSDHSVLKPIIEAFAADTDAFADYIRAVRDASQGIAYDGLHALYRTISLRAIQQVRRNRLRKAVLLLLPQIEAARGAPISYPLQTRVAATLEKWWGAARMMHMADEREALQKKRLKTEDRELLLDSFWADIDRQLDAGHVPLVDHSLTELIETLT